MRSPITPEDYEAAAEAVRADAGWREALRRRGVDDVSLVQIDVLASGGFGLDVEHGRRVARAVAYLRRGPGDNGYAHPIESLIAYVDVDECRVLELEEMDVKPIPLEADGAYAAGTVPARDDLRPIAITQPEGVSFTVEGNEIRWYRWSLRAAVDPQEGLVLHDVRFDGRPVAAPRVVRRDDRALRRDPTRCIPGAPTSTPASTGSARARTRSRSGATASARSAISTPTSSTAPAARAPLPNAICLHEEDAGLLWKHSDELAGRVEVRRARRFVVNSMVTVGNYDYAFRWYLHLDGSIECEVQLHGIVSTMALAPGEEPAGSTVVDRGLAAPNHQHFFCFRLDLDVDGVANSVREVEAESVPPGPENPLGNAFRARVTPLVSEVGRAPRQRRARRARLARRQSRRAAMRSAARSATASCRCTASRRCSRSRMRASHSAPGSPATRSGSPATTRPSATRPAATPTARPETVGLPQWSAADRPLDGSDVVLWYTVGTTHFVRPEDWPIMPVARAGFRLEPVGFFDRNPSLDVAPPRACHGGRTDA